MVRLAGYDIPDALYETIKGKCSAAGVPLHIGLGIIAAESGFGSSACGDPSSDYDRLCR